MLLAVFVLAAALPALAGPGGMMGGKMGGKGGGSGKPVVAAEVPPDASPEEVGAFFPVRADLASMRARGFLPTGLTPAYPEDAQCLAADSMFATDKRGDGSPRSPRFFQGFHSGTDIPAPEGTPILAAASGLVVHTSEGLNIGGIGLILQHAPEDTGLPVWAYTEYKHLRELPADLPVGTRVARGQKIGEAGVSGTTGGYYGDEGHSHLHFAAYWSKGPEYKAGMVFIPTDGQWVDVLALYRTPPLDSRSLAALPAAAKRTPIPYQRPDGNTVPPGSKVIWPFACSSR
jgi:murein DD-endopeptidase MepM/ murein hydrolase activator NlpD